MSGDFEEIDKKYSGRMLKGKKTRKYLIYPDDIFRTIWDFTVTL
jgi:hypothetical protein